MPGEQLDLSLVPEPGHPLPPRVPVMQPSPGPGPFDDRDYLFEPWWPGVRARAWVSGGRLVRLDAEGLADALVGFGELADELPGQLMEDGVVLDGWLLALDDGGWLDPELLRRRVAGDRRAGRPGYVASDLLWADGVEWHRRPFSARRERLEGILLDGDRCVVSHALRGEGTLLAEALGRFSLEAISARHLAARVRRGPAGERWLRLPIRPTEPTERPRLALIQRLPFEEPDSE